MKRKIIAAGVSIVLLGLAIVGCSTGAAGKLRHGDIRTIDSLGMWSLEKLGYSDLVFPCQEPREEISVEYILPEDAAQGPETWYIFHLHFSIKFSEESKVTGFFPYGRTYVGARTNDRPCAMVTFRNKEEDGKIVIDWNTGSENLLGGGSWQRSTSLNIEDVRFASYLCTWDPFHKTSGVLPSKNVLTFTLEQCDGAKVQSLTIFADSGIECTSKPGWEGEPGGGFPVPSERASFS